MAVCEKMCIAEIGGSTIIQKYWINKNGGFGGAERATDRFSSALGKHLPIRILTLGEFAHGKDRADGIFDSWPMVENDQGRVIVEIPTMQEITDLIINNREHIGLLQIGWGYEHYPKQLASILGLRLPTILRICEIGHFQQLLQEVPQDKCSDYRKLLLNTVDRVVAISSLLTKEAENFGFPYTHIDTIYSTVPTALFKPVNKGQRRYFRSKYGFSDRDRIFLYIGRFAKEKGIDLMLHAWNDFQQQPESKDTHLVMVGGGDNEIVQCVMHAQNDHNLNIHYLGIIDNQQRIAELLQSADIFTYPSFHNEGLSVSVLEAMSSSCPVISTEWAATHTGMKDLLLPNKTGLTFDGSKEHLVSVWKYALSDQNNLLRLGVSARRHVLSLGVDDNQAAKLYRDTYCKTLRQRNRCLKMMDCGLTDE